MPADAGNGEYPLRHFLRAQVLGVVACGVFALVFFQAWPTHFLALASLQGCCALLIAWRLQAPPWWLPIHLVFMPCVIVARDLELPSWIWAGGFLLLLMVFWRTDKSRVPLYMTNFTSRNALLGLLPCIPSRIIDLGCGDGALLRHLARARPDCCFVGIEHAPLPWAWARLASRNCANLIIRRGDFWSHPLADYALVYAFLSPAAMARLEAKAQAEMSPGACLVSNSFPFPERMPQAAVDVPDKRGTCLHVYRWPQPVRSLAEEPCGIARD